MDSLRLHNASSAIIHRIKDLLNPEKDEAGAVGDVQKSSDQKAPAIKQLIAFLDKAGVADDYHGTFAPHGIDADWLRERLVRRASGGSKLSTILGDEVIRMRRSGQDTVEFASLLWLIYKHCFQSKHEKAKYARGVPKKLLPGCNKDGSFDFTSAASHFGRIALHQKDTSNTSVGDLVKISYEHNAPPPDLKVGDALCEWMDRLKPLKLLEEEGWTEEEGSAFDKLKVEIEKSVGAPPKVRGAWYRKLFQQFVSRELDWRQDAVAAKLKAEIPLVLIWSTVGRKQTLKLERVEGGHADHLPNVFVISGALDELVMAWVAKQPGPTVSLGDPTLSGYKDFIAALGEQLERLKKATRCTSINIPKDGTLVQFVLPLAFFQNPVVLVAEYTPPQIPLSLSFNFSIAPFKEGNALGTKQLCDWAARCIVTLHNFLSESASLLNDCALESIAEAEGQKHGFLASKHDYSKDLNSNDIRMDRYERHVKQEREKLQLLIEKTSALETTDASGAAKSFVVEGLKEVHREYGVPMLDLLALTRYQMMRQKAKDAGSLYEEPQFCVERLIYGTKNDVVRVVNLLVWMRSPEWIDPARAPQENGRDFAAWGRIFAYETVASNHLSRIAEHLFHKLGFQLEELDHYFPRPLLRCIVPQDGGEIEPALTEPFLWPQQEGNPVRPHLFGFFPLFVEAMRAAYLHAYAATLDRALALGRKQDVPQRAVGVQHPFQQFITLRPTWRLEADGRVRDYRLKISFSGPPSPAAPSIATLPLGDWHSETAYFEKLVSQWKASEATEVIAGQQAPAFSITIASH